MSYRRLQIIWMLGVRSLKRPRGYWTPTSPKWFNTRTEVKNYIETEIHDDNFDVYEYKPIKYAPVRP